MAVDVGDLAPEWDLELGSGDTIDYPAATGGYVSVLFFFATWCPYCASVMPHLDQIQQDYEEHRVRIYALSTNDDGDPVAHIAERGYDFLVFPAADLVADDYSVNGVPDLFVVDGEGVIRYRRLPGRAPPGVAIADVLNEQIRSTLDELLERD